MLSSPWLHPLLFLAGVLAGWIDSIAGGGGLITIPVLLGIGLPPGLALGTNKFQSSFGSLTATSYYIHKRVVDVQDALPGAAWTLVGAAGGAFAVEHIDPAILNVLIPFLLLAIAVYMLFSPYVGDLERRPRAPRSLFYAVAGIGLGFYDGFFGPGVGSFWAIAFVAALGFGLTRATGYTKVMNFTSNIVSFLVFLAGGNVLFAGGLAMGVGEIVGARIGSGMVVKRGARFIRPIFIGIVILTTLKLLYNRFG